MQQSYLMCSAGSADALGIGVFGVTIDLQAPELTKAVAPASIICGGTATYTFEIDNNLAGAINRTDLGFTDYLPAGIRIAATPNVVVTGAANTPVIIANPGGNVFDVTDLSVDAGIVATITVDVTNAPNFSNEDCASNPSDFTNGFFNVTPKGILSNEITDQCLEVVQLPVTLDPYGAYCVGQTPAVLSAMSADGFQGTWFPNTINTSAVDSRYYVFTPNDGCYRIDSVLVDVTTAPSPSPLPNPATLCEGTTLNLDGNPDASGTYTAHSWSGAGAGNLDQTNIQTPVFSGPVAGNYDLTYTVTDVAGCTGSQTITVTVNTNPSAAITPNPADICNGGSLSLNGGATGGSGSYASHLWSGPWGYFLNATNTITPTFTSSSAGTHNITYQVTDNSGCIGTTNLDINVATPTTISLVPTNPSGCNLTDGIVTVNGAGTGDVSWTGTSSGGATGVTLPFDITGLGSGSYTVVLTLSNGCTSNPTSTVLSNPGASTLDAISDTSTCGTPIQLNYSDITGTNLTGNQAYFTATGGNIADQITDGTTFPVGSSLTVFVYDNNGTCDTEITFELEVNDLPTPSSTPTPAELCSGSSLQLNASATGGAGFYSYSWSGVGAGSLNQTNIATPTFTSSTVGVVPISVDVTDANGCSASFPFNVEVMSNPTATIMPDPITACLNETVNVSGIPAGGSSTYNLHSWSEQLLDF